MEAKEPAPAPATCEFCGKTLYHLGTIIDASVIYGRRIHGPEIIHWSNYPERCDCPEAVTAWVDKDKEAERQKQEEQKRREESWRQDRVQKKLDKSGIKKRFLTRTFESFRQDTPERAAAYKAAKDYADSFKLRREAGKGLYIEGTVGTGKTHLAAAIALQLLEQEYDVIMKAADDLFRDIKRTFDDNDSSEHKLLDRYKDCDLLVIDDIGKEQATDWTTSQLYAIINDRYENLKPVIITTNFNEDGLAAAESPKGIGEHRIRAILSRLHETTKPLTMAWKDWRTQ